MVLMRMVIDIAWVSSPFICIFTFYGQYICLPHTIISLKYPSPSRLLSISSFAPGPFNNKELRHWVWSYSQLFNKMYPHYLNGEHKISCTGECIAKEWMQDTRCLCKKGARRSRSKSWENGPALI